MYPQQQFPRLRRHTQIMGRHQLRGIVAAKPKLSERDCHTLKRIVSKNHRATAAKVAAELNIHLEDPFPQNQSDKSITNPTFQDDS